MSEQITEKLIEFSTDGKTFVPKLATSWKQLDDTTVELKLRKGVTFTNGEKFTAASAAYSINEIMLKATAYSAFVSMIASAKAVGPLTIDVTSKSPTGLVLNALAMGSFQYPEKYFESVGLDKFGTAPIGTGPFVLDTWSRGDRIAMTANKKYWGGAPGIGKLTFQVIPDKSAQVAALQSKQVDLISDVPVGSIDSVKSSSTIGLVSRPSNRIFYLLLSELTDTPLRDKAVRKALWYAIDTKSLIKNQLDGYGTPLHGSILAPNYLGYSEPSSIPSYNPTKAKKMLADAGYPNGFTVTFKYSSGRYAQDVEIGQAIAAQLAKVGVTVKQEVLESGTFLTQLTTLQLNDMALSGSLPPPDAHFMYQQFKTGATYSYYSNTEIDSLLAAESSTVDQKERLADFKKMTEVFMDDPAYVPLFQGEDTYGVSKSVVGFTPRASQFLDLTKVTTK